MALGGSGLGGSKTGSEGIGSVGLKDDSGQSGDYVRITTPPDNGDVIDSTPWNVSSSEAAEIRIDAQAWAPATSGVMSDLAGWSAILADTGLTLEARLIAIPAVTHSITLTKRDGTLTIDSPAQDALVLPSTTTDATSTLPREARLVVDAWGGQPAAFSAWRSHTAPVTLDVLGQPPGGGASIFPGQSGVLIRVEYRLTQFPTPVLDVDVNRDGSITINSPAADSHLEPATAISVSTEGGGLKSSCDGGTTWATHWAADANPGPDIFVNQLGAPPANGGAFTALFRHAHTDDNQWDTSRNYIRSWEITITSPAENSQVNATHAIVATTYGATGTLQFKISTEGVWANWFDGFAFGDLSNWGAHAEAPFVLEGRILEDPTNVLTWNYIKDSVPSISITAPAPGSTLYDNSTDIVVATTDPAELSFDTTNWTDYSAGGRADAIGGWSAQGVGAVLLAARHKGDAGINDTRAFDKAVRTLSIDSPAADTMVFKESTFTVTASGGTAEARIGTGAWADYTTDMRFDALTDWGITNDGTFALNVRLKEDNAVTDTRNFVKATRTLTIDSPPANDRVLGSTPVTMIAHYGTAEVSWNGTVWADYSPPQQMSTIPGWDALAEDGTHTLQARLKEDNAVTDTRDFQKTILTIDSPAANANVLSTDTFGFTATGGVDQAEAQILGDTIWITGSGAGVDFNLFEGFSALAYLQSFVVTVRYKSATQLTVSRSFDRSAFITIDSPDAGTTVSPVSSIDLSHDGFGPEVRVTGGTWTPWMSNMHMQGLADWDSITPGSVFTMETQLAQALAYAGPSRPYTRQIVLDAGFAEAGADQATRQAAEGVTITDPLEGAVDINGASTFSVTADNASHQSHIQVSVNGTDWDTLSSGTFSQITGFSGIAENTPFTLSARQMYNIHNVDTVNLTTEAAPGYAISILSPLNGATDITGSTTFQIESLLGGSNGGTPQVQINAGTWDTVANDTPVAFSTLTDFASLTGGVAFTFNARVQEDTGVTDSINITRASYTLSILSPSNNDTDILPTDTFQVQSQLDGSNSGTPEVQINAGSWEAVTNDTATAFSTLTDFAGVADGAAFTFNSRVQQENTVTDGINLTKADYTISILSPLNGATDIGDATTFRVQSQYGGVNGGTPQVRIDTGTWDTVTNDTDLAFSTLTDWASVANDATFTFEARVQQDTGTTDSISLTKEAAPAGAAFNVGIFTATAGATQQVPHGCTVTPTAVDFFVVEGLTTLNAQADEVTMAQGAYFGGANRSVGTSYQDGQVDHTCRLWGRNSASIRAESSAGAEVAVGSVTAIDATNITITWSVQPTHNFLVQFVAYSPTDSFVDTSFNNNGTSGRTHTHSKGSNPGALLLHFCNSYSKNVQTEFAENGDAATTFVVADPASNIFTVGTGMRHGRGADEYYTCCYHYNDGTAHTVRGNASSVRNRNFVYPDTNTITSSGTTHLYLMRALWANQTAVGEADVDGATVSVTLGWRPDIVYLFSSTSESYNVAGSGANYQWGLAQAVVVDSSNKAVGWAARVVDRDPSVLSNTNQIMYDTGDVLSPQFADDTYRFRATPVITATGFQLNVSERKSTPSNPKFSYLAIKVT